MASKNDVKCVSPWGELYIDPDGSVKTCCIAKPSNVLGNINVDSWQEIWNGEKLKEIRRAMLNGEKHFNCKHCYQVEDAGQSSLRTELNDKYGHLFEDIWNKSHDEDENIVFLDIRWSNLCNFSCRMCSSGLSYKWQQLLQGQKSKPIHIDSSKFAITDLPLDSIQEVYIAGGEPLMISETFELLDKLIEIGRNTEVKLWLVSNCSLLQYKDKHIFDYLKHFKEVMFQVSLDGANTKGEYIRQGMDWPTVSTNIRKLYEYSLENNNIMILINYTLWPLNSFHLDEFIETLLKDKILGNTVDDIKIFINAVQNPWYMDLQYLPDDLKNNLIQHWQAMLDKYNPQSDSDLRVQTDMQIQNLRNAQNNVSNTEIDNAMSHLMQDLYTQDTKYFGTSLFNVFPELQSLKRYYEE